MSNRVGMFSARARAIKSEWKSVQLPCLASQAQRASPRPSLFRTCHTAYCERRSCKARRPFNLAFFSLGRLRSNLGNDPAGGHQAIWLNISHQAHRNFGGIAVVSHQITVIPSRVLIAGHRIYDPEACRRRMRMFHHRIKHAVSENRIPGDSSRHRHNFLDDLYSLMGIGGSYRNPDTDCMGRRRDIFQNSLICEFETASMLRSLSYQREGQEEKKACKE